MRVAHRRGSPRLTCPRAWLLDQRQVGVHLLGVLEKRHVLAVAGAKTVETPQRRLATILDELHAQR